MRSIRYLLGFAAVLAATSALADTVEATSTTYLSSGRQFRRAPFEATDTVSVLPVVEALTVAARGVRNPVFDNLEVVVSTWGSLDLPHRRWAIGTLTRAAPTGHVRGQLLSRRLPLRAGRENVSVGAGRVASIDGADLALR